MTHRPDLARDTALSTIAGSFVSITSFVSVILIARVLGVEGAGLVAFAIWISFTGAIVANPGAATSLARYLPELRSNGIEATEAFGSVVLRCVAVALVPVLTAVLTLSIWTPMTMSPATWALIAVLLAVQTLSTSFAAYLKGLQRFDQLAIITLMSSILQLGVMVVGLLTIGINGALIGYVAGALLPAAYACRLMFRSPGATRAFDNPAFRRRVVRFSLLNWGLAVISAVVWYRAELFFLKIYRGPESVGLFSTGLTLANIATLFPALLLGALLPHFSGQIGRNEIKELQATYTRFTRLIAFLVFPICFGIAAICPVLVPLLYGQAFTPAVPSAMIVLAGSSIGIAVATNANVVLGFERTHVLFITNSVGLVLMLAAGVTVIPAYGLEGAAGSRIAVQFVIVAMEFWYVIVRLKFTVPIRAMLKTLGAAAVCAVCAYAIAVTVGGVLSLLLAVPLGAAVYVLMIRLLGVLQAEDRSSLEGLLMRLPKPLHYLLLKGVNMILPTARPSSPD